MSVVECLDAALRGETVPWARLGATNDELLSTCESLEISALLHQQLSRGEMSADWPGAVRRELARRARATAARDLVRTREIADVLEALSSRQIQPILFKGAALGHLVYGSAGLRPHADTDFMVRREDIDTVREIFHQRGYRAAIMSEGELVFGQFEMMKTDRFGVNHIFDVHWRISTQSVFAQVLSYDEIAAEAVDLVAVGPCGRAASGAHSLLVACIHPIMHHRDVNRLIWLYDIHLLVTKLPPAELGRFAGHAVARNVAAVCAHQLTLAMARFHSPVPAEILSRLLAAPHPEASAVYLQAGRRWHHEMWWNVRALGGWRDRFQLLREVLLPAPQYMLNSYHLGPVGIVLIPTLYVHRWVRGAIKILCGRK